MTTLSIKEYKQIGSFIARNQQHGRIVPLVWGAHGIGKTQVTEQIAKDADMNFVVLNLANQTPEELLGYPDRKGGYLRPEWMVKTNDKPTLYFLDEINRAPKYVLQSIFNFIAEGRIHTHRQDKEDCIIAAANPVGDDYEVTDFTDVAFMSRFAHFYLEPTHEEISDYMSSQGIHPGILTTLKQAPDCFDTAVPMVDRIDVTPDPRAIHRLGLLIKQMDDTQIGSIGAMIISAQIGYDLANVMVKNIQDQSMVSPQEILDGTAPKNYGIKKTEVDKITAINTQLASLVVNMYKKGGEAKLAPEIIDNLRAWLKYIPAPSEFALMHDICRPAGSKFLVMHFDNAYFTKIASRLKSAK